MTALERRTTQRAYPIGPMMAVGRKLLVARVVREYCNARNGARVDALEQLLGAVVMFDSQHFREPIVGRDAVLAHLRAGWQYMRAAADPLEWGSYTVREVSLPEAVDVPCGVLCGNRRDEHLCIIDPDAEGRIERLHLMYSRTLRNSAVYGSASSRARP